MSGEAVQIYSDDELNRRRHRHDFTTDGMTRSEKRTRWVIGFTFAMMVVEIVAGIAYGSMALLVDGWHMGTHVAVLAIAVFAYSYARRHADDRRYTFGTGKVPVLGGFGSAVGLAVVAALVFGESVWRLLEPEKIYYDEAIAVAVLALIVNTISAILLREDHHHHLGGEHDHLHRDHNLRAAFFHVVADALTSLTAIVALLLGKYFDWTATDALMGMVGAVVIGVWAIGLLRGTGRVLLDGEAESIEDEVRKTLEEDTDVLVSDLHIWRIGPIHFSAIVSVVTSEPKEPDYYRERLAGYGDLAHVTVEVHRRSE